MKVDTSKTSSYASGGLAAIETMLRCGADPDEVISKAGLARSDFSQPAHRIPSHKWFRFLHLAWTHSNDPTFGLISSEYIHPMSYHAWGLTLLSSSTIGSYIDRWERFYAVISTHGMMRKVSEKGYTGLQFQLADNIDDFPGVAQLMADANLAVVVRYLRMRLNPGFEPQWVELKHPAEPRLISVYREYLGKNIRFESDRNAVWFSDSELEQKLPGANSKLARKNDELLMEFLRELDHQDVPTRVRAEISKLLPAGDCSKAAVANAMFMTTRTLQNRLREHGVSYRALLDATRLSLATQYLRQPEVPISEIPHLVGYSDYSNFSRWFRGAKGESPRNWRQSRMATK